ncbi:MAG: PDZ domain-containing protein [Pirellulaceae bacterium]|nr:PDZ domain-containing protein [Pirellulaceae bacterium]
MPLTNRGRENFSDRGCRQLSKNALTVIAVALIASVMILHDAPTATAQDDHSPEWLRQRLGLAPSNRRDNGDMTTLVRPIAEKSRPSVAQILSGGRPVALGTIVGSDGYVLTKRSELTGDPVRVRLSDGRLLPARVAAVRRASDLALLKVETATPMQPIQFVTDSLPIGSFVITPGRTGRPIGLGVLSVRARRVAHQGRLGVMLDNDPNGMATVQTVYPHSGAQRAGVKKDDRIIAINGRQEMSRESVIQTLRGMFPGENVRLTIVRAGDTLELNAQIRDMDILQETENDTKVNGPRSVRLNGFEQVMQHDTVLDPDDCGGPVLDSKGRAIGINIARAGRVVTYALPSSLVVPEMNSMLREARANSN